MRVVTPSEMSVLERRTIEEGSLSEDLLMERAGMAVARGVLTLDPEPSSVVAIVGKGNNGADAVVALRHLAFWGIRTTALLLYEETDCSGALVLALKRLSVAQGKEKRGILPFSPEASTHVLRHASVILDGILGTGFRGTPSLEVMNAIAVVNKLSVPVLSVDIPTGVNGESGHFEKAVNADRTVTFGFPKWGLLVDPGCRVAGEVVVSDIGLYPALMKECPKRQALVPDEVPFLLPKRPDSLHKGQSGHVLVWGGSPGKWGAPMLSGLGAQRAGAGLVSLLFSDGGPALSSFPEQMIRYLPPHGGNRGSMEEILDHIDVVAMGPGLLENDHVLHLSRSVLDHYPGPVVADAGVFTLFAKNPEKLLRANGAPLVLTPHPGEFARLLGLTVPEVLASSTELVVEWAQKLRAVILLKGHRTLVASPEGLLSVNLSGAPNMATAGSGDVLTGIISGFLSQQMASFDAARLGAYLHGLAGERLASSRPVGILARELADAFGLVLSSFYEQSTGAGEKSRSQDIVLGKKGSLPGETGDRI